MTQERLHIWEEVIDDEIRQIFTNYDRALGLGENPALLCIDNYNAVFGDAPKPVLEAMEEFPSSCGLAAWEAIEPTRRLMYAAREEGMPVIHTTSDDASRSSRSQIASTKRKRSASEDPEWGHAFFHDLQPEEDELVIYKSRASAFYGTPLPAHLVQTGIDTLIVCGNSTSGCVRASVVDAYSAGYKVAVVEECVFDRNWLSHRVNLFDLNSKYADVVFLDEALEYIVSATASRTARV